jgi:hypothetical protein
LLIALRTVRPASGGPKGKPAGDERHRRKLRVSLLLEAQLGLIAVSIKHMTGVFKVERLHFQSLCSCGWLSTISYLEEVDLLRAMHAHAYATFKSYQD